MLSEQRCKIGNMDKMHKIKNELSTLKVFFTAYDSQKSVKAKIAFIEENKALCLSAIEEIERVMKRVKDEQL